MAKTANLRVHERINAHFEGVVVYRDPQGHSRSLDVRGVDMSKGGVRLDCPEPLDPGASVYVQVPRYHLAGEALVRHSGRRGKNYSIGLQFNAETASMVQIPSAGGCDYYEFLQISRSAETETIHRVFRIMAARFHPDNPETGDKERFLRLVRAYETLSDPVKRAEYDARHNPDDRGPLPIFELRAFVDDLEGEANRRLGILCLLYNQRRSNTDSPGLSLLHLERLMALPREYLTFTIWYLREKEFVRMTETSDYALTAAGADHVESSLPTNKLTVGLLTAPRNTSVGMPPPDTGAPDQDLLAAAVI